MHGRQWREGMEAALADLGLEATWREVRQTFRGVGGQTESRRVYLFPGRH